MNHFFHIEGVAAAIAILLFTWGLLKGLYQIVRAVDDNVAYVKLLKNNHIPHLNHWVKEIAFALGIKLTEPEDLPQD
jgi:hypothetical protein